MRQTALFEVAGTGALTAWRAPAGYWPTDGAEGGVRWGDRSNWRLEGVGVGGCRASNDTVGWSSVRSGNWHI